MEAETKDDGADGLAPQSANRRGAGRVHHDDVAGAPRRAVKRGPWRPPKHTSIYDSITYAELRKRRQAEGLL